MKKRNKKEMSSRKGFLKMSAAVLVLLLGAGLPLLAAGRGEASDDGTEVLADSNPGRGRGGWGASGGARRGQGPGGGYGLENDRRFSQDLAAVIADAEGGPLTEQERVDLLWMREEEKLARDLYAQLYRAWNLPIFNNISRSEQQHMDSLKLLLDEYGLEDPAGADQPGYFDNPELQKLYEELLSQGRESLTAALQVGAAVEDLDIKDLQEAVTASDNDDLRIVYQNLMKGSRNHLRSFDAQLERQGVDYQAKHISPEYLDLLLGFNRETAPIDDPEYSLEPSRP